MVKKLLKHEFFAYSRVLLLVQGVLLAIALVSRIIEIFENDSVIYSIVSGAAIFTYVVAVLACMGFAFVFGIIRFYKNFFTGEGYLTFTLPATPTQHLFVKLITSLIFSILSLASIVISFSIITAGDVWNELVKAFMYIMGKIPKDVGVHLVFYVLEIALMLVVALGVNYLLYYACISLGQLFRKNRILCSVAVYFGYYLATQILGTVLTVLLVVLEPYIPYDAILEYISNNTYQFFHLLFCGMTVVSAGIGTAYFFINKWVISKKLNLE